MPHETSSDQALVEKVQQATSGRIDLLVVKYQYKVIGLIGRYVQDRSEVLDVAQESFY